MTHVVAAALSTLAAIALVVILACAHSEATVATPSNTDTSSPSCSKDADCKGDRICDHGSCVSPR